MYLRWKGDAKVKQTIRELRENMSKQIISLLNEVTEPHFVNQYDIMTVGWDQALPNPDAEQLRFLTFR